MSGLCVITGRCFITQIGESDQSLFRFVWYLHNAMDGKVDWVGLIYLVGNSYAAMSKLMNGSNQSGSPRSSLLV
jgi:hypothetical protein